MSYGCERWRLGLATSAVCLSLGLCLSWPWPEQREGMRYACDWIGLLYSFSERTSLHCDFSALICGC